MNSLHDLFLLMFTLSHLRDRTKIIQLFQESISELFKPIQFNYTKENKINAVYSEEISTRNYSYGYIYSTIDPSHETKSLLQNAIQMLAVILDRLKFENKLQKKADSLETITQKQLIEIKNYVDELETARLASLNLIEDLRGEIEDRKRAELSLQESEDLLRLSSELANVAAFEYDFTSNSMKCSKNHNSLYGLGIHEKWEYASFGEAIHPEDREISNFYIENSISIGGSDQYKFDYRVIYPDDSIHWLNVIGKVIKRNKEGKGILVRGFLIDITERKQAEESIKESEEKFKSSFHTNPAAQAILNEKGIFVELNNAFSKLIGFTKQQIIGKSAVDLDLLSLEERKKLTAHADASGGTIRNAEVEFKIKDGSFRYVLYSIEKISLNGIPHRLSMGIDITDRKKAEEALQKSNSLLKSIIESPNNIIMLASDLDFNYLSFNQAHIDAVKFTYGSEPEIGKNILSYIPVEEDRLKAKANYIRVLKGERFVEIQEFGTKDTRSTWELIFNPIINTSDQITGFTVFVYDITEKKQAEEALREAKELLTNAIDNAPVGTCLVKTDGYFSMVNKSLCDMFDYSETELKTKTFLEVTHPDDSNIGKEMVQSMINGELPQIVFEKRYLKRNGDVFYAKIQSSILKDKNGVPIYFFTHIENITERKNAQIALKKSEEKYKLLFDLSPESLIVTRNGLIDEVNNAALELLGLESKTEIIDTDPMQWVDKKSFEIAKNRLNALYEKPKKMPLAEYNIIKKNGEIRSIDAQSASMSDEKGLYSLAVLRDITEKKQAELEIIELNQTLEQKVKERTAQLQASNKELETFTYSVSHDLKAPLRGIDGYSKLLLDLYASNLNEEAQRFIKTIRSSTLQMNQLIDDLLNYSRLERSQLSIEPIKIKDLIASVLSLHHANLEAGKFKINMNTADIVLLADPRGLTIALRNILGNAIKFTQGKAEPLIQIAVKEKDLSWIISVNDNGIGFDMRYHQKIFDIFQRLQRVEDFPGTGIGLAMVSKAMQRMHGRVWAESTPNLGSTFYLEIPKKQ